jgi:hypothetical protein
MTIAEFLDWDDDTNRRYQLIDGMPMMMAPATAVHGELAVSLGQRSATDCDRPAGRSARPASRFQTVATPTMSPTSP